MRTIPLLTFLIIASPGIAQENPFYQAPQTGAQVKAFAGKQSQLQGIETTMQAIAAFNQQTAGQSSVDNADWVTIDSEVWRNPDHVTTLSTFIRKRLTYAGVLSSVEMTILTKALTAMMEIPPTKGTGPLRRDLQTFYNDGYAADDLTVLAQRRIISRIIHPRCSTEIDVNDFEFSAVAKRFERRERFLRESGAPTSPIPKTPSTINPF